MKRSKTSRAWMHEHVTDPYVKRAKSEGYRSRAAFKLLEIDEKDRLFRNGMTVVDLGSTPGGWSQVAAEKVKGGKVIALDILPMEPISGVDFIQGDFREEEMLSLLEKSLDGRQVDLVISDMAPNLSGVGTTDQARSMHLAELALEFSRDHLKPGGFFLVKVFQGEGYEDYLKEMRAVFHKVLSRKPKASRDRSSEVYLLGLGKN
ncbi:MAG: 23S rRNA (uridine(2552)-2'-O)-methyltransferase RlmE [Burkholderiales bacterium]|nr:23S rRNA (uridine(2552)-2'-O)-methyltransferase RlmE [Burkholderiales bacterium]